MKYYTGNGDEGLTDLTRKRVKKDNKMIEFIGTLDELNAFLGYSISKIKYDDVKSILKNIETQVYKINAIASGYSDYVKKPIEFKKEDITQIEESIDKFSKQTKLLLKFIYPNGDEAACLINICRVIARRAERQYVRAKGNNKIILSYINRLSSLLFVLFRTVNDRSGFKEETF